MIDNISKTAEQILAQTAEPVLRYRLLRDVLGKSAEDVDLRQARENLASSRHIQELAAEQWPDGSWGSFHSQNTKRKQKILTTEAGVARALALGLDADHPILQKVKTYILQVMDDAIPFPDRPEKNDRWPTGQRLFLASTLSLIDPHHPALERDRQLWLAIAARTLQSGVYNAQDEIEAHHALTGATVKNSYLMLNGKYQLTLLGVRPGILPQKLEIILLRWVCAQGIGYLNQPLIVDPPVKPGLLERWLASWELLARAFPHWVDFGRHSMKWLFAQQDVDGWWDFGPRAKRSNILPLSESWRRRQNRRFDWTTRTLILLRQYADSSAD